MKYYEISHAGIKGMRWGVRRFQNPDGTLTPAGKKRYGGTAGIVSTQERKMPVGSTGGLYNKPRIPKNAKVDGPGANKTVGTSIKDKAKQKIKSKATKENCAKAAVKGAEVVSKLAMANMADDVFYGGTGKKIAKETIKQTGRAAVTAYTMARGGYDIHWYDN